MGIDSSKARNWLAAGALTAAAALAVLHSEDKPAQKDGQETVDKDEKIGDVQKGTAKKVKEAAKDTSGLQMVKPEAFVYTGGKITVPDQKAAIDFVHSNAQSNVGHTLGWQIKHGMEKNRSKNNAELAELMKKEGQAWRKLRPSTINYREEGVDHKNMAILLKGTAEIFLKDVADDLNEYLYKHGLPEKYRVRVHISSAYRTHEFQQVLKKTIGNASKDPRGSSHERGNTVDIPYGRLDICDTTTGKCLKVVSGDAFDQKTGIVRAYKNALAVVFKRMIEENKAFVKFEKSGGSVCYHAVDRYGFKAKPASN